MSDILETMTLGHERTINVVVTDKAKAEKLINTLYSEKDTGYFGVKVVGWGLYNSKDNEEFRVELIKKQIQKHNKEMERIVNLGQEELSLLRLDNE